MGSAEENKPKNRSETVIPYDRNRVILTPIPGREHSTYINASFIEGYDNSESFIITQDPLDTTIPDFWRMISEQSITTIVMLSEVRCFFHLKNLNTEKMIFSFFQDFTIYIVNLSYYSLLIFKCLHFYLQYGDKKCTNRISYIVLQHYKDNLMLNTNCPTSFSQ